MSYLDQDQSDNDRNRCHFFIGRFDALVSLIDHGGIQHEKALLPEKKYAIHLSRDEAALIVDLMRKMADLV